MSEESVDKLLEQLGNMWESSERDQDPVESNQEATHTAYATGNPVHRSSMFPQGSFLCYLVLYLIVGLFED